MRVLAATDPTAPRPSVTQPTFALVAGGEKRTVLAGHEFTYGAGQYLVTTLDLPVTAHITRADPFSAFGLALRPELIIQLLVDSPKADSPGPGIGTADAGDRLLEAVVRLLRLVEHPHDFAVLARDAEKEIHWRLLTGPLAGLVRQVGYADSHVALAGRAARWITDRFDQHIRMAELAAHMGVSTATLNRHFRAATAMSPLQYQKHVRLQRARIRLAATPDDVAAAGFAVGYDSPSQFSREYRRMFGSPPGEDARRLSVAADAGDL
ncbi:AraC family transcriptional regulator [Actinoplanes sp. TBRC 11911]|nr:AraC family transcriptional regulator [Actinoplanes sp. TBRC 11911]